MKAGKGGCLQAHHGVDIKAVKKRGIEAYLSWKTLTLSVFRSQSTWFARVLYLWLRLFASGKAFFLSCLGSM
jgi:hypothetical protein